MHIANLENLARMNSIPEYKIKACKPIGTHHLLALAHTKHRNDNSIVSVPIFLVKVAKKMNASAGLASMMQMSMGLMHGMNNMKG